MAKPGKNGRPEPSGTTEPFELSPELIGSLVHELRNPLAPIRNAAELLRTLCSDPRQLQSVDIISRQVNALTHALDDLTDALASRQSRLNLSRQSVDLAAFIEPVIHAMRPTIDRRRQSLLVALPAEPVHMYCDPLRLGQVVQALVDNATRNTQEGGSIALTVDVGPKGLQIEVQDDGTGIAPDRLATLFNFFADRAPTAGTDDPLRQSLVVARNVVELHGGTIEAFSEGVGRGSRFVIHLPLTEQMQDLPASSMRVRGGDSRRVIIIDDHEDNVASLRDVLAAAGHAVLTASTGEMGIALAETFVPDAVIIDIGLPGIDGFEVARRLRSHHATSNAVLVALSGFSLKQFKDLSAYSMFRHYLLKPASPETIRVIIEGQSEHRRNRLDR